MELPAGYSSPRAIVLLDLAVRLLKESLNEFAYAADIAGLSYRADAVVKGIALTVVRHLRGNDHDEGTTRQMCLHGVGKGALDLRLLAAAPGCCPLTAPPSFLQGGFSHKLGVLVGRIGARLAGLASAFSDLEFDMQKDAAARAYVS